jgi:hypothetical protein
MGEFGANIRFLMGHKVSNFRQIRDFSTHPNFGEGIAPCEVYYTTG